MRGEKRDPGGRNEMAGLSVMFSPAVENEKQRGWLWGKVRTHVVGVSFENAFLRTDGLYLMMRWASKHEKI